MALKLFSLFLSKFLCSLTSQYFSHFYLRAENHQEQFWTGATGDKKAKTHCKILQYSVFM